MAALLYVLDDKRPIPAESYEQWLEFMSSADRTIDESVIGIEYDMLLRVVTVFTGVGIDHTATGVPMLYDTALLWGPGEHLVRRSATLDEARMNHRIMSNHGLHLLSGPYEQK